MSTVNLCRRLLAVLVLIVMMSGLTVQAGEGFASSFDGEKEMVDNSIGLEKLYPNPLNQGDNLHIEYGMTFEGVLSLQLLDAVGNLLKQEPLHLKAGSQHIELETTDLGQGIYFLKVSDSENSSVRKFIVR